MVLITHHMDEAAQADRLVVMDRGSGHRRRYAQDGLSAGGGAAQSWALPCRRRSELLYELRQAGLDVPLDALSVDECAQAIAKASEGTHQTRLENPLEPIIETQKLTHTYSAGHAL